MKIEKNGVLVDTDQQPMSYEEILLQCRWWRSKDGMVQITDMTDRHLANTLAFLAQTPEKVEAIATFGSMRRFGSSGLWRSPITFDRIPLVQALRQEIAKRAKIAATVEAEQTPRQSFNEALKRARAARQDLETALEKLRSFPGVERPALRNRIAEYRRLTLALPLAEERIRSELPVAATWTEPDTGEQHRVVIVCEDEEEAVQVYDDLARSAAAHSWFDLPIERTVERPS